MPFDLEDLPTFDPETGLLNVIVDTPKGSRNKYKYDPERSIWQLSKMLPLGAVFPYNFGFLPGTRGDDGDALDVLVLMDEPAFAGCLVSARLIGVIEAEQTEDGKTIRNDRLVAAVETPHNPAECHSLKDLSQHRLDELEHFFISYNKAEGRKFRVIGQRGPKPAHELIEAAQAKVVEK